MLPICAIQSRLVGSAGLLKPRANIGCVVMKRMLFAISCMAVAALDLSPAAAQTLNKVKGRGSSRLRRQW